MDVEKARFTNVEFSLNFLETDATDVAEDKNFLLLRVERETFYLAGEVCAGRVDFSLERVNFPFALDDEHRHFLDLRLLALCVRHAV